MQVETEEDLAHEKGPEGIAQRWLRELDQSSRNMTFRDGDNKTKEWEKRGRNIVDLYRDEHQPQKTRFNVLLATTEVLKPSLFSRAPQPDVRRRHTDSRQPKPVARMAAQVIERALAYTIDETGFAEEMEAVTEDFLLPGRGTGRIRFVPHFGEPTPERRFLERRETVDQFNNERFEQFFDGEEEVERDTVQFDDDGEPFVLGEPVEELVWSEVRFEHVYWENFRHSPARNWRGVRWVAFREYLTRRELIEQFGDVGKKVRLTADNKADDADRSQDEALDDVFGRAEVWEIWSKTDRKVYVVSPGHEEPLAVWDDPLGLGGFFPMPAPAIFFKTTNTMTPVPPYVAYKSLAEELYNVQARIDYIVRRLKLVGFYPGDKNAEIDKLLNAGLDTALVPVGDFKEWQTQGGAKGLIDWMPVREFAQVLNELREHRAELLGLIREITGITDIQRGVTNPREPNRTQRLKAEFGMQRQQNPRLTIERMVRDAYALMAEVMAEKFDLDTLKEMSGIELPTAEEKEQAAAAMEQAQAQQQAPEGPQAPQIPPEVAEMAEQPSWDEVMALLRDDGLRGFRINVETEATVQPDAAEEQQRRTEFVTALTQLLQQILPAVTEGSMPAELAKALVMFGVRGFKVGREIEDALDQIDTAAQGKGPDAKEQLEAQKLEQTHERDVARLQFEQQKHQDEMRLRAQEIQQQAELRARELQQQAEEAARQDANADADRELKRQIEAEKLNAELSKADAERDFKRETEQSKQQSERERERDRLRAEQGDFDFDGTEMAAIQDQLETILGQQSQALTEAITALRNAAATMNAPKRVVRDDEGRPVGIAPETVQ